MNLFLFPAFAVFQNLCRLQERDRLAQRPGGGDLRLYSHARLPTGQLQHNYFVAHR